MPFQFVYSFPLYCVLRSGLGYKRFKASGLFELFLISLFVGLWQSFYGVRSVWLWQCLGDSEAHEFAQENLYSS